MKASKIRDMSSAEMRQQLATLSESLFNLRFQHSTGQLENKSTLKKTKKDIARIKTVLNEIQK